MRKHQESTKSNYYKIITAIFLSGKAIGKLKTLTEYATEFRTFLFIL